MIVEEKKVTLSTRVDLCSTVSTYRDEDNEDEDTSKNINTKRKLIMITKSKRSGKKENEKKK